ncbi:hypothetical protein ACOJVU_15545 [Mycobacterium sp. THU-M104]|uniref:hypothetical protein n=1 Tax=Mycobacterium sp. THU-M104 TaxID=3410515 RepID=UPI003B9B4A41
MTNNETGSAASHSGKALRLAAEPKQHRQAHRARAQRHGDDDAEDHSPVAAAERMWVPR